MWVLQLLHKDKDANGKAAKVPTVNIAAFLNIHCACSRTEEMTDWEIQEGLKKEYCN